VHEQTVSVLAALAASFVLSTGAAAGAQKVTLTLDWTPNPDHVGFYDALDKGLFAHAGLNVSIHAPSSATDPLKLVGVGRSDLGVSYEPELFLAAAKKLPVVAVAAVVPQPLNSLVAIEPAIHSVRDLKGRTVGITGVPSDYATLDTMLASAGVSRKDVKVVSVGYNLLPALLAHRVDAVLGVYRNVEGIQLEQRGLHPTIIPVDRAGVPSYDELVLVANRDRLHSDTNYRTTIQRFVTALLAGTADARSQPARAITVMGKVTSSSPAFLSRSTRATLPLLAGPRGTGCLTVAAWQRFGNWMLARGLLKAPVRASSIADPSFLPRRCR
jgi:putative hydroxymethylpyrimidine transport system substrate-binding protein